eukprot:1833003-Prymnesium_polylepis.1
MAAVAVASQTVARDTLGGRQPHKPQRLADAAPDMRFCLLSVNWVAFARVAALAGTGLGDLELKGLFQSIDVDGSGEIGLHEFADFVQNEMNLFERFDGIVKREKRRRDEANTLTG